MDISAQEERADSLFLDLFVLIQALHGLDDALLVRAIFITYLLIQMLIFWKCPHKHTQKSFIRYLDISYLNQADT